MFANNIGPPEPIDWNLIVKIGLGIIGLWGVLMLSRIHARLEDIRAEIGRWQDHWDAKNRDDYEAPPRPFRQ